MKMLQAPPERGNRADLMRALPLLIRKEIRAAMMFVHSVAECAGIHPTDIRCVDFLAETGSATAGKLAEVTGLTTGAITAVIDRMERAGFVRRERDEKDKRRVIVTLVGKHVGRLQVTRDLFADRIPRLLADYTVEELGVISDWNEKISLLLQSETKHMRDSKRKNQ